MIRRGLSLYLFEPGESDRGPYFCGLEIPTICSVSPDKKRYKEFLKDGAEMLYMPTWTLEELQAVGKFMASRGQTNMLLDQDDISARFEAFGGIFRHVFAQKTDEITREQDRAILSLDPKKFLFNELAKEVISHYVAQYRVTTDGKKAFREANVDFLSDTIRGRVEAEFLKLSLDEMICFLRKNDKSPSYMRTTCEVIYEDVIARQLREGVVWKRKNLTDADFSNFDLKMTEIKEGELPKFAEMKVGFLYRSLNENHPAIDMMFKTEGGLVYGLQVTRQQNPTRKFKTTAVDKWLEAIDMKNNMENFRIAVIPRPDLAGKTKAEYEGDGNGYPRFEVWKVPSDYGRRI